jgi:hypothetical protein
MDWRDSSACLTVDPELLAAVQADKERRDKEKFEAEGCTMCSA